MDATTYHRLASATLESLQVRWEESYNAGKLEECELTGGILTLVSAAGKTWVVSQHEASQQLWLASPISGGLHFEYVEATQQWQLKDGRELVSLLQRELAP